MNRQRLRDVESLVGYLDGSLEVEFWIRTLFIKLDITDDDVWFLNLGSDPVTRTIVDYCEAQYAGKSN